MKVSILSKMVWFLVLVILVLAVLAGCDIDSTGPENSDPELTIWLGSYTESGGDDSGAIMLDISSDGRKVTAEIVCRSHDPEGIYGHVYLKGSADGDDIDLHFDPQHPEASEIFDVQLTMGPDGTMTGYFYTSVYDMTADFDCSGLEWADATVDTFFDVGVQIRGMAFDGEHLWISTYSYDHLLIDSTTAIIDTIAVLLEGYIHFTSESMTSDGNVLWNGMPITVSDGGIKTNESNIIEFEKNGDIIRIFRFSHRISGLAWSGEDLWALSSKSDILYRMDLEGSVIDAVAVGVPDLYDIEFDGTYFWAFGWYMERLYKISSTGEVLMVYHLPGEHRIVIPGGLAFDGSHYWCGFITNYPISRILRLSME